MYAIFSHSTQIVFLKKHIHTHAKKSMLVAFCGFAFFFVLDFRGDGWIRGLRRKNKTCKLLVSTQFFAGAGWLKLTQENHSCKYHDLFALTNWNTSFACGKSLLSG